LLNAYEQDVAMLLDEPIEDAILEFTPYRPNRQTPYRGVKREPA